MQLLRTSNPMGNVNYSNCQEIVIYTFIRAKNMNKRNAILPMSRHFGAFLIKRYRRSVTQIANNLSQHVSVFCAAEQLGLLR